MKNVFGLKKKQKKRLIKNISDPDKFEFLYFRMMGPALQKRLAELFDLSVIPKVFLHGNPHVDNYAKTHTGSGMIDFDRSRIGPYIWDVMRFLSSLALQKESRPEDKEFLSEEVTTAFLDGYQSRFHNLDLHYLYAECLKRDVPGPEEATTSDYLKANLKWARKMRKTPIKPDDPFINKMLLAYLEGRDGLKLLENYSLTEAGKCRGSLGKLHYILALTPKDLSSGRDHILLDLKETYQEQDGDHFYSPTEHHGLRMIKASNLYAPGVEQRLGHFTVNKMQYWGREIPSFKTKIRGRLTPFQLQDLAYSVGTQLGRGHRRSIKDYDPFNLSKHLEQNFEQIVEMSLLINKELALNLDFFVRSFELENELEEIHRPNSELLNREEALGPATLD